MDFQYLFLKYLVIRSFHSSCRKREMEHTQTVSEMKDKYENEIKHWQSKFASNEKDSLNKEKLWDSISNTALKSIKAHFLFYPSYLFLFFSRPQPNSKPEESNSSSSNATNLSKSSRRKGRGRHRNSQKNQNYHLNDQFTSSSLW